MIWYDNSLAPKTGNTMLYFLCTKNYSDGMDGYTTGYSLSTWCRYAKWIGSSRRTEILPRQMARLFCTEPLYTPPLPASTSQCSAAQYAAAKVSQTIPVEWTRCDSVCQYPRLGGQGNDSRGLLNPSPLEAQTLKEVVQIDARVHMLLAIPSRIPPCWQMIQVQGKYADCVPKQ